MASLNISSSFGGRRKFCGSREKIFLVCITNLCHVTEWTIESKAQRPKQHPERKISKENIPFYRNDGRSSGSRSNGTSNGNSHGDSRKIATNFGRRFLFPVWNEQSSCGACKSSRCSLLVQHRVTVKTQTKPKY